MIDTDPRGRPISWPQSLRRFYGALLLEACRDATHYNYKIRLEARHWLLEYGVPINDRFDFVHSDKIKALAAVKFNLKALPGQGECAIMEEDLSKLQIAILQLSADGCLQKEIAGELHIDKSAVSYHIHRHILPALEARNIANAVAIGLRCGIIE